MILHVHISHVELAEVAKSGGINLFVPFLMFFFGWSILRISFGLNVVLDLSEMPEPTHLPCRQWTGNSHEGRAKASVRCSLVDSS